MVSLPQPPITKIGREPLLLVAGPHHLAGLDVRALLSFLDEQKHTFNISFSIADPQKQPELLELHRLAATPALIKLDPAPKQIFAGNAIQRQLQNWLPRWQQLGMVSGLSSSLNPSDTAGGTSQREMQLEDQLLVLLKKTKRSPHAWACRNGCCGWWPMRVHPLTAANWRCRATGSSRSNRSLLDVIDRRLEDLEPLAHDLLEVGSTRWEALFNPQRLGLAPIAAESILELEKLWVNRRLELLTDVPSDLPDVYADQRRMRQVILNLLENALKFTPDGGQVSLKLLHRTNQWVQVSVSDTGPGIPTEEQQRIFQDRVRLPQTAGQAQGFGVGLSVCRRIVEVHGGRA